MLMTAPLCNLILFLAFILSAHAVKFTIVHFNDIHGRIDPQNKFDADCSAADVASGVCMGGTERISAVIKSLREDENRTVLVLDAGDEQTGTIWDSYYQGVESVRFQKAVGVQAFTLGNHEFDRGPSGLATVLEAINGSFPVLSCNLVDKTGLLSPHVRNSTILTVGGVSIGIIGATTEVTAFTSSGGPNVAFLDPVPSVKQEAARLKAQGVKVLILLSHLGYPQDQALAKQVPDLDVIVGGHSHTYLYTPTPSNPLPVYNLATGEADKPQGPYPTFVPVSGNCFGAIPVVQARWAARYVGVLDIEVDEEGDLVSATGSPVLLGDAASSSPVTPDASLEEEIAPLRQPLELYKATVVGSVAGDFWLNNSKLVETPLGDMVCDALLWYVRTKTSVANLTQYNDVDSCIINGGSLRSGLQKGNVTLSGLVSLSPFSNTLTVLRVNGSLLRKTLELGFGTLPQGFGGFPQVSGLAIGFDPRYPPGDRVRRAWVYDKDGILDGVYSGENYTVVTNSYMAGGGDNYTMLVGAEVLYENGPVIVDVLYDFFQAKSPVAPVQGTDERLVDCSTGAAAFGTFANVLCNGHLASGDSRRGPWDGGGSVGESLWTITAILTFVAMAAIQMYQNEQQKDAIAKRAAAAAAALAAGAGKPRREGETDPLVESGHGLSDAPFESRIAELEIEMAASQHPRIIEIPAAFGPSLLVRSRSRENVEQNGTGVVGVSPRGGEGLRWVGQGPGPVGTAAADGVSTPRTPRSQAGDRLLSGAEGGPGEYRESTERFSEIQIR